MIWLVCHGDRVRRDAARTEVRTWASLDNLARWLKAQGCWWCEQGDGVLVTLKFFKTSGDFEMHTPKLINLGLVITVFCMPLTTQITPDMLHQPAYGWHRWHQADRHIEPREPFYPLVSSETLTATGSFTESTGWPLSRPSTQRRTPPSRALLALMRGAGKSAHHDLDPHDLPMRA